MTVFSNFFTRSVVKSVKRQLIYMERFSGDSNSGVINSTQQKHRLDLSDANDSNIPKKMIKSQVSESCKIDLEKIKAVIREKYNVTFEAVPKKSESDKKEYLVMKLSNGLTALLISDAENLIDQSDIVYDSSKICESSDESSDTDNDSNSEVSENGSDNEECTDKTEKLAACALTVGVGSFSDPEAIPGLAHFLEHMVFMGSKKFPKENDFDSYISSRGGSTNASTECEYTSFHFDCPDKYLCCSMDRFANFFVSPLMKRDSMSREREAVESEFKLSLTSDSARTEQLFCSTAPLNNPVHKFMWGNLITLQKNVSDDVLYNTLREFWSNQYSANRMTVAVQARLPLDIIGIWVAKYFGEIPSNNLSKNVFPFINPPFRMELFNKMYIVRPIKDTNSLQLTWAFPSVIHLYKSKPLSYISYLIGHEGEGSLLSYLQEKLWALQIVAGTSESGIEYNSMYSLFSIDIGLTDEGLENVERIIALVFSYIKLLQHEGPSESVFKEIQNIDDLRFRFQRESDASDYVEDLSKNMQFYPPIDYITAEKLITEYKPAEITKILNLMTPKNVNIMVLSKSEADKVTLDCVEPWFNTKFRINDIPDDLFCKWENCGLDPNFFLPKPNIYIPCNFSIIRFPKNPIVYPKNVLKTDHMEVWYKPDTKFKLPYSYIKIYLISSIASISPQNSVMCDIFVALFNLLVVKETYPASLAKLNFSLSTGDNGLILTFNGFTDKMPLLLVKVITEMVSFARKKNIPKGLFEAVKTQQRREYCNRTLKASKLANEIRLSILCSPFWSNVSKLEAMHDVTIDKCTDFNVNLFENLYVKCLIQGNICENLVMDISSQIKEIINHKPLNTGTYPKIRTRMLPPNENIIRVQSFSTQDINCNITNYYQCGLNNVRNSCIIEILMLMMEEPLFDTLRTQEQLAYEVSCGMRDTQSVLGFTVTVKSQADKFNVEYVENRITLFLNKFLKDLEKMKQKDFNQFKESLIILKLQEDSHLKDEVKRNWDEMISDEYMFDRIKREVKSIESIQLSDLIQYFKTIYVSSGNNSDRKYDYTETCLRKLSIQVDAEGHSITEPDSIIENNHLFQESDTPANSKTKLQIKVPDDINVKCKFITDIENFKSNLFIYPCNFHICQLVNNNDSPNIS